MMKLLDFLMQKILTLFGVKPAPIKITEKVIQKNNGNRCEINRRWK